MVPQYKLLFFTVVALLAAASSCLLAQEQATPSPEPGRALAAVKLGDKWGFVDKKGKLAIPMRFEATTGFYEQLAAVTIGKKTGYVDRSGRLVIPAEFDFGFPFLEQLADVRLTPKGYQPDWSRFKNRIFKSPQPGKHLINCHSYNFKTHADSRALKRMTLRIAI